MASYTEIANELAKTYVQAKNKKYAINQMVFDINYLSDPKSKLPLDYNAKASILKVIHELLAGQRTFKLKEGEEIIPEFKDITIFFERKRSIIKELKLSNKERAMLN
jgi:hypothetical protein